jgi:hypothetical protein
MAPTKKHHAYSVAYSNTTDSVEACWCKWITINNLTRNIANWEFKGVMSQKILVTNHISVPQVITVFCLAHFLTSRELLKSL